MWNESQACNRILKRIDSSKAIGAYSLYLAGFSEKEIGKALSLSAQGAKAAIRLGRFLNDQGLLASEDIAFADAILDIADLGKSRGGFIGSSLEASAISLAAHRAITRRPLRLAI